MTCTVTVSLVDIGFQPVAGIVTFQAEPQTVSVEDDAIVSPYRKAVQLNADGEGQVDLIPGYYSYVVSIQRGFVLHDPVYVEVPDTATAALSALTIIPPPEMWDQIRDDLAAAKVRFPTRAALIAARPTLALPPGTMVAGGDLSYLIVPMSPVIIPDAPGLAPAGDWTVDHFGAVPSADNVQTNVSAHIQAAFNALPATGGEITFASRGVYYATGIRLDGATGGKSGCVMRVPAGVTLRKPDHARLTTDAARKSNVVEALSGHAHKVVGEGAIEGNWSRGGRVPIYTSRHQLGSNWGSAGSVRSVAADGTSSTISGSATDDVYQVTPAGAGQPSSAVNVSFDVAAGFVVKVYDHATGVGRWNEATGTGFLNAWDVDTDYAYRHVIYMNGMTTAMQSPMVEGLTVRDGVFAAILLGAGPLFADLIGFGTDYARIIGNKAEACGATLIAGGHKRKAVIANNVCRDTDSSGIRLDEGSHDCTVTGNIVDCNDRVNSNDGINAYKSDRATITGNWIAKTAVGVSLLENAECIVVGNHIFDVGTGMSMNAQRCSIVGNRIDTTVGRGIVLNGGTLHTVTGNSFARIGTDFIDDQSTNSTVALNSGGEGLEKIRYNGIAALDFNSGGTVRFVGEDTFHNFEVAPSASGPVLNRIVARGGANGLGSAPSLSTDGTTADIDLRFLPKGNGRLRFGSFTAASDAPITGFVEVKTADGTIRRLAVIA